jgi:sphinganine-1-phosphate aldolase
MSHTDQPPSSSPAESSAPTTGTKSTRPTLPTHSRTAKDVLAELAAMRSRDARWHDGRTFSLVYHDTDEHLQLLRDAYTMFLAENALNPMAFPSLRRMETDVVSMCAGILGGDDEVVGSMTSGGTESLFLAMKTYRDQARKERPHITAPEVVLPTTAHPALIKSAHYLSVKVVLVPPGPDFRADVAAMERAITPQTLFLVARRPRIPTGWSIRSRSCPSWRSRGRCHFTSMPASGASCCRLCASSAFRCRRSTLRCRA